MTGAPATRPIALLIAALGGEGGGVLTNWIVAAAHRAGYPVQATSIPGVAQRTGATTYYVEVWPQPLAELDGRTPILALAPAPGEVDIVVATELLEAGRTILNGYATPDRTHLIASTHRVYTTREKMGLGDGRHDPETLLAAATSRSKDRLLADMGALAAQAGSIINAVMLGAVAGSGVLPFAEDHFTGAIRDGAKAVDSNLRGFQAGLNAAKGSAAGAAETSPLDADTIIAEGERRLAAYQDRAYADLFLSRLAPFRDSDATLLAIVARHLLRRMAYGDIIHVAHQKLRAGVPDGGDTVVHVTQYLKPGIPEIADILPSWAAKRLLARAERDPWLAAKQWPMALRTTTVFGVFRLWALSKLKPFRRGTHRYKAEQYAIDAWLDDVRRAAGIHAGFAVEVAGMARLIKGYGKTHRRGLNSFNRVRDGVLIPALNGTLEPAAAAAALSGAVEAALQTDDGSALSEELARVSATALANVAQ